MQFDNNPILRKFICGVFSFDKTFEMLPLFKGSENLITFVLGTTCDRYTLNTLLRDKAISDIL